MALDNVSLTVTPSSEANSAESGGIRVDGRDTLTQPIPAGVLKATSGRIRFRWRPRHSAAQLVAFAEAGTGMILRTNTVGAGYIQVHASAANTIQLGFDDGGGVHTVNWNCAGLVVADTEYLMEVRYTGASMQLLQDGVVRATVTTAINFTGNIPTVMYWGSDATGANESDSVFLNP